MWDGWEGLGVVLGGSERKFRRVWGGSLGSGGCGGGSQGCWGGFWGVCPPLTLSPPAFQFSYTAVFGAYTAFLFLRTGGRGLAVGGAMMGGAKAGGAW